MSRCSGCRFKSPQQSLENPACVLIATRKGNNKQTHSNTQDSKNQPQQQADKWRLMYVFFFHCINQLRQADGEVVALSGTLLSLTYVPSLQFVRRLFHLKHRPDRRSRYSTETRNRTAETMLLINATDKNLKKKKTVLMLQVCLSKTRHVQALARRPNPARQLISVAHSLPGLLYR